MSDDNAKELLNTLRELLANKDNQIEELVAERERLRQIVRDYMKTHEDDTRKISELFIENAELKKKLGAS